MTEMFFAQFDGSTEIGFGTQLMGSLLFSVIWGALMWWKLFEKAGKPGWASVVPIYQYIVLAEVAKKPIWWGLAASLGGWIPFIGIIITLTFFILLAVETCRQFNKLDAGTVILCILCGIGFMIIGFGDARYSGEASHDEHF